MIFKKPNPHAVERVRQKIPNLGKMLVFKATGTGWPEHIRGKYFCRTAGDKWQEHKYLQINGEMGMCTHWFGGVASIERALEIHIEKRP